MAMLDKGQVAKIYIAKGVGGISGGYENNKKVSTGRMTEVVPGLLEGSQH